MIQTNFLLLVPFTGSTSLLGRRRFSATNGGTATNAWSGRERQRDCAASAKSSSLAARWMRPLCGRSSSSLGVGWYAVDPEAPP